MLVLIFRAAECLYGIDAKRVVEVVPRVDCRRIPHSPAFISGLLSYRGRIVPVIDFGLLTGLGASRDVLSTRVILSEFTADDGSTRTVGLVAENVSHVVKVNDHDFIARAMSLDEAPYLGSIAQLEEGLVHLVNAGKLVSSRLQDALYGSQAGPSG